MRLILSAAVLALWTNEAPNSVVEAFSIRSHPRFISRPGFSTPSLLHMSTIERPMTAPNSPNSTGHPFGAYGKPPQDGNRDSNSYSYGPQTPPGTVDRSSYKEENSFEAYMQGRNRGGVPPRNPASPSDNYFSRQQSAPSSNFGAPSTPSSNTNNNFGAPSTPSSTTRNNDSFSGFAERGNAPNSPPQANNFGAPSSSNNFGAPSSSNNFGAPSSSNNFGAPSSSNNFGAPSSSNNFGAPSSSNNFGAPSSSNNFGAPSSSNNFGAPSSPQTAAAPTNSFADFVTGGNSSSSPPPPAAGSFEEYMNSRSGNSQSNIPSSVAAAADPNSPLPPYMSPASLENSNIKSANIPGSPSNTNKLPDFQPPMPGMATQHSTSTATTQTTFREPETSMTNQLAPPITAPLARAGTPATAEDFVGRLDQVLNKQREFEVRLDKVDEKLDRTTQENIERTKSMLNEFREDNRKTQETFLNRINSEVHGMKSTMDKVLNEQRELKQKQDTQSGNFNNERSGTFNDPGFQQERARMSETERQLQDRLEEAQNRKQELLHQLQEMEEDEQMRLDNNNRRGGHEDPHSMQGGPTSPSSRGSPSRFDESRRRESRFEEEEEEVEQPRRSMLRDRLGKASGEQLYQTNGAGGRGSNAMEGYDNPRNGRMNNMDSEDEMRMQHEQMMRRDPASPPVAMGPRSQRERNGQRQGSPAGRYDPRRGGPSDDMMEDELAYGISGQDGMHKTLNNMRSYRGDEQMPNKSLFDDSGAMGGAAMGMGRRGAVDTGMRQQHQSPGQRSGAKQRRAGLSQGPPPNPLVDKKLEHFLKESLKSGPQPHFDKEMESLLMIKYSPLFSWLKPANVAFLRNVLVTYLQHKGAQVEMDLQSASPKAAREWDELLNILSFELQQRTGEEPRIMEEPDNQWGIYGSKNLRMKISSEGKQQERQRNNGGGLTREEAARRKRRNDQAFKVSTDPTDPTTRLL